jgi:hypothetical protein
MTSVQAVVSKPANRVHPSNETANSRFRRMTMPPAHMLSR